MNKYVWIKYAQNIYRGCFGFTLLLLIMPFASYSQQSKIELFDKSSFLQESPAWTIAGGAYTNPLDMSDDFHVVEGEGLLVGSASQGHENSDLISEKKFGDIVLEFEVMTSHGANAELFMLGKYGMVIADSWGKNHLSGTDNGSIVEPEVWVQPSAVNIARQNVSKAPGSWQHFKIEFETVNSNLFHSHSESNSS